MYLHVHVVFVCAAYCTVHAFVLATSCLVCCTWSHKGIQLSAICAGALRCKSVSHEVGKKAPTVKKRASSRQDE